MRRQDDADEAVGQDSFLDVVANIVGILILLVMVVGARASLAPTATIPVATPAPAGPTVGELKSAFQQAAQSRVEVEELVEQTAHMQLEAARRNEERQRLQMLVSAVSAEIENQRQKLTAEEQQDFDLRRQLAESHIQLEDLSRREMGLADIEPEVEEIKNLPTPLSTAVTGEEVFMYLSGNRVAVIPLHELLDTVHDDIKKNLWRLDTQDQFESVVGPIGDFRLRYYVGKTQVTVPGRGTGILRHMLGWQIVPVGTKVGEPIEQALENGSRLTAALANCAPERTTITIAVYPDSFATFGALKESLHGREYQVAVCPIRQGKLIQGGPNGDARRAQ